MELQKGKGNGSRKAYNHLATTGIFGVSDKIKAFRKPYIKPIKKK